MYSKESEAQAEALVVSSIFLEEMKQQVMNRKESEAQVEALIGETLVQFETAKKMWETVIRSDGRLKTTEAYDAIASELEQVRARLSFLEDLMSKLKADTGRPPLEELPPPEDHPWKIPVDAFPPPPAASNHPLKIDYTPTAAMMIDFPPPETLAAANHLFMKFLNELPPLGRPSQPESHFYDLPPIQFANAGMHPPPESHFYDRPPIQFANAGMTPELIASSNRLRKIIEDELPRAPIMSPFSYDFNADDRDTQSVINTLKALKIGDDQPPPPINPVEIDADESVVTVVVDYRGEKTPVEVDMEDTVSTLREKLKKMEVNVPEDPYLLIHRQDPMEDDKTMKWHRVKRGDEIAIYRYVKRGNKIIILED